MSRSRIDRKLRRLTMTLPPAVRPYYWHTKANEPIGLLRGDVFVRTAKGRFKAKGAITAEWRPTPHIACEASGPLHPLLLGTLTPSQESIEIPSGVRLRAKLPAEPIVGASDPQTFSISTTEQYRSVGHRHLSLDEVRFALPNFPDVFGRRTRWPNGTGWRVELAAPNHVVVLDGRPDYSDIQTQLAAEGGYGLTHAGSLVSKRKLTVKTVEGLIDALYYFLSLRLDAGRDRFCR